MEAIRLALCLVMAPSLACLASDMYLARLGPAPLRFAPAPSKSKDFVWPVVPKPSATTNSADTAAADLLANTNSVATAARGSGSKTGTNSTSVVDHKIGPLASGSGQTVNETEGNPLAASNLLVVTPQMLADYFKANLDSAYRGPTNAPGGPEVFFNPPLPKAPASSEAIYRTQ